jgi:hypothetical protein
MCFRFRSTPDDWISHVWPNRRGAASTLIIFVLHQYNGAANILKITECYWFFAFWCYRHSSTNILVFGTMSAAVNFHSIVWNEACIVLNISHNRTILEVLSLIICRLCRKSPENVLYWFIFCHYGGVGSDTTLAWPGWKQHDIPVEVDTDRLETSRMEAGVLKTLSLAGIA